MNRIEEELWNYIDGAGTEEERRRLTQQIADDRNYRARYEELLRFNEELSAVEPDEPSMGFSYRVMEQIREEQAAQVLQSRINMKLIYGIGIFFILSILLLLAVVLFQVRLSASSSGGPAGMTQFIRTLLTGRISEVVLFTDAILALVLIDAAFRHSRQSQLTARH